MYMDKNKPKMPKVKMIDDCPYCERKPKTFVHTCKESTNVEEINGCPKHDDVCGHCHEEFF